MKVLIDSCVAPDVATRLRGAQHDVVSCHDWESDPGDEQILDFAVREERVLVTIDKDFGTLVFAKMRPHCGIIRLVGLRASQQAQQCSEALGLYENELLARCIVTVESFRVRVSPRL